MDRYYENKINFFVQGSHGPGNLEISKIISRSRNCQGILKNQEKLSESWKKLIRVSEFGKSKVVDPPQPDDRLSVASEFCYILLSSVGS